MSAISPPETEGVDFESVLAAVSARLLAAAPEQIDEHLQFAVERFVAFFDADRGAMGFLEPDGTFLVRYTFARPGFGAMPLGPLRQLPNYVARIRAGEGLVVGKIEDLPPAWVEERAYAASQEIQSLLMFPLRAGPSIIGAIGLSSLTRRQAWSEAMLRRFRLFGEILASAILRTRKEKELGESLAEMSRGRDRLNAENVALREVAIRDTEDIVGRSAAIRQVLHLVEQVAPTNTPVLVTGETGTGKELVARAICAHSRRRDGPLVFVNCAALPGTLIESELFGYERGSFTGALQRRIGRFEVANGGTLVLDEVGDLPLDLQGRLLRALQQGTFERIGSSQSIRVDVRVIAVTNRNLEEAVAQGRWRADLYYRLRVFPIEVPPLRDRRDDIPLLVWYFITRKRAALGRHVSKVPDRTMEALQRYDWHGNVRELENVIQRALILSTGDTLELDPYFLAGAAPLDAHALRLEDVERAHIVKVIADCGGKIAGKGGAAEVLGLNRSTLRSRMQKLGLGRTLPRGRTVRTG